MPDFYKINRDAYKKLECYSPIKENSEISIYNVLYHPFPPKDLIKSFDAPKKSYTYTGLDQFYIEFLLIGLKLINNLCNIVINIFFCVGKLIEPFVFAPLFKKFLCNEGKKSYSFWNNYFIKTLDKPYSFFYMQAISSLECSLYNALNLIPDVSEAFILWSLRSLLTLSWGFITVISIEEDRPNSLIGHECFIG